MELETSLVFLFIFRSFERLVAICFGGLAVYLGFRLFLHLPEKVDSDGKIILPGNVSIYLSRIGPGIFFAVFGLIVVAMSLYFGVTIGQNEMIDAATGQASGVTISGAASAVPQQTAPIVDDQQRVRDLILTVNLEMPGWLRDDLTPRENTRLQDSLRLIKLQMMQSVWADDWGDSYQFSEWVSEEGAVGAPPAGTEAAYELLMEGLEGDSP